MVITNPQAVKYCNENIRVAADKLSQAYYFAKATVDEWTAHNMGALIPVSSEEVEDGANVDGRPIITGNDVTVMLYALQDMITDYEASNKAKLNSILKIAPNPIG
jgi:galactitol-specific phosphotransferase system IIB component